MSSEVILRTACPGAAESTPMTVDEIEKKLEHASTLQEIGWWMKQLSHRISADAKEEINKLVHAKPAEQDVVDPSDMEDMTPPSVDSDYNNNEKIEDLPGIGTKKDGGDAVSPPKSSDSDIAGKPVNDVTDQLRDLDAILYDSEDESSNIE